MGGSVPRWLLALALLALFCAALRPCSSATDWQRVGLGRVTHASLAGRHVRVATAQGVVASLSARTGDVGTCPRPGLQVSPSRPRAPQSGAKCSRRRRRPQPWSSPQPLWSRTLPDSCRPGEHRRVQPAHDRRYARALAHTTSSHGMVSTMSTRERTDGHSRAGWYPTLGAAQRIYAPRPHPAVLGGCPGAACHAVRQRCAGVT